MRPDPGQTRSPRPGGRWGLRAARCCGGAARLVHRASRIRAARGWTRSPACVRSARPARRTAPVVVDMVPFFVEQNEYARGIVLRTSHGSPESSARRAGRWRGCFQILHHRCRREQSSSARPSPRRTARREVPGRYHDRLWHQFDVNDGDLVVDKTSAGAFFPGHCDLSARLDLLGVRARRRHGCQRVLRIDRSRCKRARVSSRHGRRRQRGDA